MEIVLSIAGSDPSSGAGIQQDLKTLTAMGCYGATVITALTSQNTMGVQDVYAVPANGVYLVKVAGVETKRVVVIR
jgi:hydroxymethylpyrimidine/phosphomethylpyrimidine kinase